MDRNFISEERQKFRACVSKLRNLVPSRSEESRKVLNALLDDFNSIDYSIYGVIDEDAGQILYQACRLVPLQDNLLVTKVCQLIVIVTHQKVKLSTTNTTALLEFVIGVSKQCVSWMLPDTLRALGAVIYENGPKCETFLEEMLLPSPPGLLQIMVQSHEPEVKRTALLCVANACMKSDDGRVISEPLLSLCFDIILSALHTPKPAGCDDHTHVRFLLGVLRGLQNLLSAQKNIHVERLGSVLAALKSYSLYGLPGIGTNLQIPSTLFPSSLYQSSPSPAKPSTGEDALEGRGAQSGTPKSCTGRKSKKRGGKKQHEKEQAKLQREKQVEASTVSYLQGGPQSDGTATVDGSSNQDALSFWPSWGRVSSSESEYSDSEGAQASKLRSASSKVRQASLGCLHSVVKNTDKRQMFGYWSAFIPDAAPTTGSMNPQTLFTCMLKDPSPKARVASVAVIMALLDGSKQFLVAADDRVSKKTAFTPFSYTLACTIKEVHRSLLLALVAESFHTTITQIIKCLSMLAMNVPYNHLEAGLLTRIVRALKPFFFHQDSNVRTACLTCIGAILGASPPLEEVTKLLESSERPRAGGSGTLMLRLQANHSSSDSLSPGDNTGDTGSLADMVGSERGQSSAGSAVTSAGEMDSVMDRLSPEDDQSAFRRLEVTDVRTVHPATVEDGQGTDGVMSWLVRLCSDICLPADTPEHAASSQSSRYSVESLPVRIESLQVLTQMVKGYFHILRGMLMHITHIIIECLADRDSQIQLHSLKVLEELGKTLLEQLDPESQKTVKLQTPLQPKEAVQVWRKLLSGTLPRILQDSSSSVLQSCACDCLSTMGHPVFELLQRREGALCITLLLGLSNEEDFRVKAASIRALGVFVLYPCLRQDVLFVADTANAILNSLKDSSVNVRMRATWSLGNLSDAMLTNLESGDDTFVSQFSDLLLQRLFEAAIQAAGDHDKVKSNAVRSLGMLVRFLQPQTLAKSSFQSLIEKAVLALLKNINGGAVKVIWNACYALGNMFRNPHLGLGTAPWGPDVYRSLVKVITECKNFKVRINGALALSIPSKRQDYGAISQYAEIWACLVKAIMAIGQVAEISELKYRDTLRDQLCQTIIHLTVLVTAADLPCLYSILEDNVEMMHSNIIKYSSSNDASSTEHEAQGDDLTKVMEHLESLQGLTGIEGSKALDILKQIFILKSTEPILDDSDPQSMVSGIGLPLD